jgi:hypothetical protein
VNLTGFDFQPQLAANGVGASTGKADQPTIVLSSKSRLGSGGIPAWRISLHSIYVASSAS